MVSVKSLRVLSPILFFGLAFSASAAYSIEQITVNPAQKDFVVGPGKQEFVISPGESVTTEIMVSNRLGEDRVFNLSTEDFTGSNDPNNTVVFLGDEKGPYSLKDYIKFSDSSFILHDATRARIPVTITIPKDAEPGGLYGSLLVSTSKPLAQQDGSGIRGGIPIIARTGVLFFIRVPGAAKEDGKLADFKIAGDKGIFSAKEDIKFQILFKNQGSVHLDPSGQISITNLMGEEVKKFDIEPWFAMPDSLRLREVMLNSGLMMGKYNAIARVYRGYGDLSDPQSFDEKSLTFWVIPWAYIGYLFLIVLVLVFAVRWFRKNFEFKKK